jgi:excisionase family DNA binding protein
MRQAKFLSVPEAAAKLQMHPNTIRKMLRAGRLKGERAPGRSGGEWRIHSKTKIAPWTRPCPKPFNRATLSGAALETENILDIWRIPDGLRLKMHLRKILAELSPEDHRILRRGKLRGNMYPPVARWSAVVDLPRNVRARLLSVTLELEEPAPKSHDRLAEDILRLCIERALGRCPIERARLERLNFLKQLGF